MHIQNFYSISLRKNFRYARRERQEKNTIRCLGGGTIHPDPLVSRPDKNQIFFKNKRKPKTKKEL